MEKMHKTAREIILKPLITEDSMKNLQDRKYTFVVDRKSNKIEIAKAVESLFGVQVDKVNTMNCKGRYVRYRNSSGFKPDWKKAIVKLTEDSKTIEFFDNMV